LGLPWTDLDKETECLIGGDIAQLFAAGREADFRAAEAEALRRALVGPPRVLSLGGGTLHQPGNLDAIRGSGWTLRVLMASWETVAPRLGERPLAHRAQALYAERLPGYRAAGGLVQADGLSLEQLGAAVLASLDAPC
jgi:shikimate kinase